MPRQIRSDEPHGLQDHVREVEPCIYTLEGITPPVTLILTPGLLEQVEASTWQQLQGALQLPGLDQVIITPDVHAGYAVPIGFTAVSRSHLYPDTVGPDPACSVSLSHLPGRNLDGLDKPARRAILDELQQEIHVTSRFAFRREQDPISFARLLSIIDGEERPERSWVHGMPTLRELATQSERNELRALLEQLATPALRSQLGSIGGGNHFLEVQVGATDELYVMAHFGSRGLGAAGAAWFAPRIREVMAQEAIPTDLPEDYSFVSAEHPEGRAYFLFQHAMLEYATVNHAWVQARARHVLRRHLGGDEGYLVGHIPHNFIGEERGAYWQRKGATPADPSRDLPLLIPGSVATGSYELRASTQALRLGASVPHGAGRVLARGEAKRSLDQAEMDEILERVGAMTNVRHVPLDEASAAYKDVDEVVKAVVTPGIATITQRLRPQLVLKGE